MESSDSTEPFFGIPSLEKEDQTYLSVFGWESQKCWSKCPGSGSPLPLQNDSRMLSAAMFRDALYQSFPSCFCLAASILYSHPDAWESFPSLSFSHGCQFPPPIIGFPYKQISVPQAAVAQKHLPWCTRSACLLPALLETHLPEAPPKAAPSEDGAAGGMGHPTAPLPFGTGSDEVLMSDTPTEHQTCSTSTLLFTLKHPQIVHNYGLAQHSPLFSPLSSCSSLSSVSIFVLFPMAFFRAFKAAHPFPPWKEMGVRAWEHWSSLNTLFTSSFIPATGVYLVPAARTCYWKNIYRLWQLRTSTFDEISSQVSIMCVGSTLNLIT